MSVRDLGRAAHLTEALEAHSRLCFSRQVVLAPWTSLKVGGPAEWSVRVTSADELARAVAAAAATRLPWLILGGGSNVLVSDRGVPGMVILNAARGRDAPVIEGDRLRLRVESGTPLAGLARDLARAGWSGLEWACGIPGTVGGAVVGNAGAHQGSIADVLVAATLWQDGRIHTTPVAELAYGYRTSALAGGSVAAAVLAAELGLRRAPAAECRERIAAHERWRRAHQPRERSAGSMFKNPSDAAAGQLIDAAGLKGVRCGGAEISTQHGNFFINRGDATATAVMDLVEYARQVVHERFAIALDLEIRPVGHWNSGPDCARRTV